MALAAAGPGLGVIDVRFVPLAQLSLALAGAAAIGLALRRLTLADVAALGLVLVAVVGADTRSRVLRHWVDWNYSGLEAKELWPAWHQLTMRLRGGPGDPRVAVEYGPVHERAGSIRMYETLPFFSGRSTLEGVYNQAATTTHPVYYLASELFARSPNPFRSRSYSRFDPESALERLRLFNVSRDRRGEPGARVRARRARRRRARGACAALHALPLEGPGAGLRRAARVRAGARRPGVWRDVSYRWFSRKPANRALLVFTATPASTSRSTTRGRRLPSGRCPAAWRSRRASKPKSPDHHQPARAPVAGEDLLPPALAGGRSGRPLPRLARADAHRPSPERRSG